MVTRSADLRSALLWAFREDGNAFLGIELTAASLPLWFESSLVAVARTRVESVLAVSETNGCEPLSTDAEGEGGKGERRKH